MKLVVSGIGGLATLVALSAAQTEHGSNDMIAIPFSTSNHLIKTQLTDWDAANPFAALSQGCNDFSSFSSAVLRRLSLARRGNASKTIQLTTLPEPAKLSPWRYNGADLKALKKVFSHRMMTEGNMR